MGELKVIDNNRNEADETAVQYIVVKVGNEQYGIDIQYIDNIVKSQRITRVPKTQKYYNGVINLRGEIIPVMSIRLKMGLEEDEVKRTTRIIIIKIFSLLPIKQSMIISSVSFLIFIMSMQSIYVTIVL